MVYVLKQTFALFTFLSFLDLFKKISGVLLWHHSVISLVGRNRRKVTKDLNKAWPSTVTGSSAVTSNQIDSIIGHLTVKWFETRCIMVKLIKHFKITFFNMASTFFMQHANIVCCNLHSISFGKQWTKLAHVRLIIKEFTFFTFASFHSLKLSSAYRVAKPND